MFRQKTNRNKTTLFARPDRSTRVESKKTAIPKVYKNLFAICADFELDEDYPCKLNDQIHEHLAAVTANYNSLDSSTTNAVDELLAKQVTAKHFKSTERLLTIYEVISRHREIFCTGIHKAVRTELIDRIKLMFDGKFDLFAIYNAFRYSNLVLEAFSEDYANMTQEDRDWHIRHMEWLIVSGQYSPSELSGVLSFAKTMTISVENAKDMPGKVGTHSFEHEDPITGQKKTIEYAVKFVENFPMKIADFIREELYPTQEHITSNGSSLTITFG